MVDRCSPVSPRSVEWERARATLQRAIEAERALEFRDIETLHTVLAGEDRNPRQAYSQLGLVAPGPMETATEHDKAPRASEVSTPRHDPGTSFANLLAQSSTSLLLPDPDEDAPMLHVIDVYDAARLEGFEKVSLAARDR